MRKIREVLRLRYEAKLSVRHINTITQISIGAIQKLLTKTKALKLSWLLSAELD